MFKAAIFCLVALLSLTASSSWAGDPDPKFADTVNIHPVFHGKYKGQVVELAFNSIALKDGSIVSIAKVEIGDMHFEAFPSQPKLKNYGDFVKEMTLDVTGMRKERRYVIARTSNSYGNYLDPKEGEQYVYEFVESVSASSVITGVKYSLVCKDTSKDPMKVCPSGTVIPLRLALVSDND